METAILVVVLPVVVAAAIATAALRRVPAGERGVVVRGGRAVRERPSGLTFVQPGIERLVNVPLRPVPIDPLRVVARSRDGVEVQLVVSVLWQVEDPAVVAQSTTPARWATADVVERTLHHLVADLDLVTLLRDRESFFVRLPDAARPLLTPLGVDVVDVDLLDTEVRVGSELIRLLA